MCFFFFFFDFSFRAPGLRLPPQVWLAFCMASISIYCHKKKNLKGTRMPNQNGVDSRIGRHIAISVDQYRPSVGRASIVISIFLLFLFILKYLNRLPNSA